MIARDRLWLATELGHGAIACLLGVGIYFMFHNQFLAVVTFAAYYLGRFTAIKAGWGR